MEIVLMQNTLAVLNEVDFGTLSGENSMKMSKQTTKMGGQWVYEELEWTYVHCLSSGDSI